MIRTQIQIHPEQMKWLKKHARDKNISIAQAVRDSIDFHRFHIEHVLSLKSKKKKTLRVIGSFSTGPMESS